MHSVWFQISVMLHAIDYFIVPTNQVSKINDCRSRDIAENITCNK